MKLFVKAAITLIVTGLLAHYAPVEPIDPWRLLNLKKISILIFALAVIQILGSALALSLGARMGSILTGFFGGLVSSTATTASLARRSQENGDDHDASEILTFLAATFAMLFEGVVFIFFGTEKVHPSLLIIFGGPLLATAFMIRRQSRKVSNHSQSLNDFSFHLLPLLKLAVLIALILAFSKLLVDWFGQIGLMALTFLISLFEIHGSVIANVQLFNSGAISLKLLATLLAISIMASYVSKLFLIATLGSVIFRKKAIRFTGYLFLVLFFSWLSSILGFF